MEIHKNINTDLQKTAKPLNFRAIPLARYQTDKNAFVRIYQLEKRDLPFVTKLSNNLDEYFRTKNIQDESKKEIITNKFLDNIKSAVEKTLSLVEGHNFDEAIWLDDNIKLTFFMNGHLQGSIIILMQIRYHDREKHYEDINMLFTGDYNNKNIYINVLLSLIKDFLFFRRFLI